MAIGKNRVILIRTNRLDQEIRLPKEIEVLKRAGYAITLLNWDRDYKGGKSDKSEEYKEIQLRLNAPTGIKILPYLTIWWGFVFVRLMTSKWDIAHAVNFDSVIPTMIAGKLKRKAVMYEILDIYEYELVLPDVIRKICVKIDKLFMRFVNGVIVADEMQIVGMGGIPNLNVIPIYDSPPIALLNENEPFPRKDKNFTLFYAGVLYKTKRLNLDKVFEVIKNLKNVKLVIAGYGDLVDEIKEWSYHMPNKVEFIGRIRYSEVFKRGSQSDLFFVLRDPIVPANKYTCGSTLFNAMICGKPILVNKENSTANKVREENCGLVVDAHNVDEIRDAIIKLRDNPKLCEELGKNARIAYEEKYSWEIMERRLVDLYRELTGEVERGKKRGQKDGQD